MNELVFTPSAVYALLASISELSEYDISFEETDKDVTIHIGDSQYTVDFNRADEVAVPAPALEAVSEVNDEGYDAAEDLDEVIEGGVIKELVKTLMIGGLVRLTANALKK